MTSLDDILKSFQAMAHAEAQSHPLLDADDYNDASIFGRQVGDSPGLIYLGCLVRWLDMQDGLNDAALLSAPGSRPSSLQALARDVIGRQLQPAQIKPHLLPFVEAYVRDALLYAEDYQDIIVGGNDLVDMAQVDETMVSFAPLWARMSERLALFCQGSPEWMAREARPDVELSESERSFDGWKAAFLQSLRRDELPHRQREFAISKFFALVDHTIDSEQPEVARTLLTSFQPGADASLQEAVLRALYSMRFAMVWKAVADDAERLEQAGWLPEVLGLWANDYSEAQEDQIRAVLAGLSLVSRRAIQRAAEQEDYARAPWAMKLRGLDRRD